MPPGLAVRDTATFPACAGIPAFDEFQRTVFDKKMTCIIFFCFELISILQNMIVDSCSARVLWVSGPASFAMYLVFQRTFNVNMSG